MSRMLLSRSVSSPLSSSCTSRPRALATSRTKRGKRRKSCSTGTMRIFITDFCRSESTRDWKAITSRKRLRRASLGKRLSNSPMVWCIMDLPIMSSPTRFITVSMRSASTRRMESGDSAVGAALLSGCDGCCSGGAGLRSGANPSDEIPACARALADPAVSFGFEAVVLLFWAATPRRFLFFDFAGAEGDLVAREAPCLAR